jgi:hypothetical protein
MASTSWQNFARHNFARLPHSWVTPQVRSRFWRDAGQQARNGCQAYKLIPARLAMRQVCLNLAALVTLGGAQNVDTKRCHQQARHGLVIPCLSSSLRSARSP